MSQAVQDGHARTGHRAGIGGRERVGDAGQRVGGHDHLVREAAVVGPPGDLQLGAQDEVALAAGRAAAAAAPEPADRDAVADVPATVFGAFARFLDASGDLVPGTSGKETPGRPPLTKRASVWQTPHASTAILTWPAPG